jgi:hypothetical protein
VEFDLEAPDSMPAAIGNAAKASHALHDRRLDLS